MKKISLLIAAILCAASFVANAQMTDAQIVDYVKAGMAKGESQSAIASSLIARGVSPDQLQNLLSQFQSEKSNVEVVDHPAVERVSAVEMEALPLEKMDKSGIFGHDVFSGRTLSFEPNENAATPETYKLGPGDQLIIDIWGYNEASITQKISPEGRINISQIGPLQLSGLTIKQATEKIKKALARKYAGLSGAQSEVSVTLGQIRSIQVNIMGEVNTPGTYRLSSFSTVFNALYRAGGVSEIGSLRTIKVIRGGDQIAEVDVYGYLFDGKSDSDLNLQDGDVVIVPPYANLVTAEGGVKRPMQYELKDGETVEKLLAYAGGFSSNARKDNLTLIREAGAEKEVISVDGNAMGSYRLENGDVVTVGESVDRFANRATVTGKVFHPGEYQIGSEIATVRQLVEKAGGPTEDAFLTRAVLFRMKDDLNKKTISIDLASILNGTAEDIVLHREDVLEISGINEVVDRGTLTINGLVRNPGSFEFSDNTTIEDLILQAGGLLEGASTARVDVARRYSNPSATSTSEVIGETFSFPISDGLVIKSRERFILEPYDVVSVRRSPASQEQRYVVVSGEVMYPGTYVIINKNETVSDIINRAGGVTERAYLPGSSLVRRANADEAYLNSNLEAIADRMSDKDSLNINASNQFNVAVEFARAVNRPHSDFDIPIQANDEIHVAEYVPTVKVQGEVMVPNAIPYVKGRNVSYYINAAGGYSQQARRTKAYIIYQNGRAAKGSGLATVDPGCTIIVPERPQRNGMSPSQVMQMGSATASMTSAIAILVNLLTKK